MEEENKFIFTLKKHLPKFFLSFVILICIAFWVERAYKSEKQQSKQDFFAINKLVEELQKEVTFSHDSLDSIEEILKRHPELHTKFDGILTLAFFSQANDTKGLEYAKSLLKCAEPRLSPFYQHYARCTLLIAEANYSQAYEEALALHAQVHKQEKYPILDALNILRIIFLAERLEKTDHKNIFWEALKSHPKFEILNSLFKKGTFTLENYLQK